MLFRSVTHPNQGEIWVYLVFEKLGRICTFCAMLGHELNSCADRLRLTRLKNSSVGQERPDMKNILSPSFGPWMVSSALLPVDGEPIEKSPDKNSGLKGAFGSCYRPFQGIEGFQGMSCQGIPFQGMNHYHVWFAHGYHFSILWNVSLPCLVCTWLL